MVDFWTNHFNVYARKGDSAFRKGADERDVVRSHALGRFVDLLRASSRSPAMLAFLDNPQNLKKHPNENYARELMELHTLGVGGGYSQRDVQEVARCFTGWTIETRFLRPRGHVRFDPESHDEGQKIVLGHVIPPNGGANDAELVLQILVEHPSTAKFISGKLVRYFYGTDDEALEASVSAAFSASAGDIRQTLKPLLKLKVLADGPAKAKRPFDVIVTAIRVTGGDTDGGNPVQAHLVGMGEPLYQWPMPDGYPIKAAAWSGNMLPRWNFAYAFAHGDISGTSAGSVGDPIETTLQLQPGKASKAIVAALSGKTPEDALAICLASPEFQWC
jgi:uncharacterized protein (DUF1800 family)